MADSTPSTLDASAEPDLSGRRLGDYQLLRRLGRGGMADVYLAEQSSLHRQVAFKVLKRNLAVDESYIRRFENEARAAASLVQANIVQIYEVGCLDGVHFIAQEYVQGQNLQQVLQRRGSFDAKLAVNILRQAAAALHKAGERQVVHRDIKPENIMLSAGGEVKVADFGLARAPSVAGRVDITQIGVTMGTPMYMSPEQVEGKSLDPRSDIYSLGITCYQMLAGRVPFEGETPLAIAVQHLKSEPERLEVRRPDLPVGLCRVVHKMLAKKPADRYQRAGELLRELRSLQIEGTGEEWPSDLEEWSTAEFLAMANARTQATKQLELVMKSEGLTRPLGWRMVPVFLLFVLAAYVLGSAWAWLRQEKPLLEIRGSEPPKVERMSSARAQFSYAVFLNTVDGYRSVWDYFPPELSPENRLETWKAKRRLAELYLRDSDLDQALSTFTELADLDEGEEPYRTLGLAGQSIIYGRRQERSLLAKTLPQLLDKQQYLDGEMRSEIQRLFREYERPAAGNGGNGRT